MKILIAFYSWTGHTETLAQALGKKLGADVVRIEPLEDPGKNIGKEGMKALFGQKEAIKPVQVDLTGIDHLIIATPVWIASVPPVHPGIPCKHHQLQGEKIFSSCRDGRTRR